MILWLHNWKVIQVFKASSSLLTGGMLCYKDIRDVEKHMPGFLSATVEWFRVYKIPDGKPPNKFAFNGVAKPHDFALQVIQETHEQWKKMIAGQVDCTVNR